MTHRRWLLALSACALAVTFGVHGKVITFPYVQEDWELLGWIAYEPFGSAVYQAFRSVGGIHYRPIVTVHHIAEYALFGEDARVSHVLVMLLLSASAVAIAALIERMTRDRVLATLVAVSHASANVIHIDPLFIQTCGIENMGGSLCFFGSALLFLHQRDRWSVLLFVVGLLVKETVIVLPGFLLLCAWYERARLRPMIARLWPFAVVGVAYAIVKSRGPSPFRLPESDPYFMSFLGRHLFDNLVAYLGWSTEVMLPGLPRGSAGMLVGALLLAVLAFQLRSDGGRRGEALRSTSFFAAWFLLAIGPMLVLPNHTYRYYLVFALPGALALWWSAVRFVLKSVVHARADTVSGALAVVTCTLALVSFRGRVRDLADLDGANDPIARADTVRRVRDFLKTATLPRGATLLFDELEVWSFGKDLGPRVWCRDPALRVFYARDLQVDPSGKLSIVNAATHQGELYTGVKNRLEIDPASTFVISKREDRLVLEPVSEHVQSRDRNSQRSEPVLSGVQR